MVRRKCRRRIAEMAQVSVRTGARGLALAASAAAATSTTTATSSRTEKKRKLRSQELDISTSHDNNIKVGRSRRRVSITPENSILPSPEVNSGRPADLEDRCSSRGSDHGSASCCSSNGSSERIELLADLKEGSVEVETSMNHSCREREETTASSELQAETSEELDSTARMSEANSRRRSTATAEKMPTESELQQFFSEAEKKLQKQFADKYNYDIMKDEPFEGRYEWVRLKP